MPDIIHLVTINAAAFNVYALTEQERLSNWWTKETIAKPEINYLAEFKFGKKYHNKMRITELVPNKRVT